MMNTSVIATVPPRVTLVAVTKTLPASSIVEAYRQGIRHFGENYVGEFEKKYAQLPKEIQQGATFHMIGHVQSRKIKKVAELFDWVDSVDSVKLAQKLDEAAGKLHKKLHVLFQINISGEAKKSGFHHVNMLPCEHIPYRNMSVEGLMTMPPAVTDPEGSRNIFRSLKHFSETVRKKQPAIGSVLSMGTSQDYQVAIDEGATMVRLGTMLFGEREKKSNL
ncbi:YggS family pyridoxal phosphate-dependent enzyme [Candidatus Gottesmanbacteria bacterium]|nr:YggS family pyridoxal phosphate-dependent enzyme [Candidatus Gottesmanbacteria bacterium]